ncbi:AAA family ATPase [Sorangium sp. So ce590]|uniref:AAA family ATPase n=1 Tax=unclassified Sorangium TaxID=2621164 RepID=UPI003F60E639
MASRNCPSVLVLGTSSLVGKTLVTLAICRWLSGQGKAVAPFKPMSMSSGRGSYLTASGGEIHVHQAHQAMAANLEPHVDMNPLMFKAVGDKLEIIVCGAPSPGLAEIPITHRYNSLRAVIVKSHRRLAERFDHIVIEGCGSPVELNIKERDMSNCWVAETFDARCLLVGSAEQTGVFASIIGTLSLLTERERSRVAGFVINKFHGDPSEFADGVRILEDKTGIPCMGVIPFLSGITLVGQESEAASAPETIASGEGFMKELDRCADHIIKHLNLWLLQERFLSQPPSAHPPDPGPMSDRAIP